VGLTQLIQDQASLTTVVLDDAYQHRRVRLALNILLTEQQRPFYADYVLPAGRLRERRQGARRADLVVVTKCPAGLSEGEQHSITAQVHRYTQPRVPVLFSTYGYGAPVPVTSAAMTVGLSIVLLTGIAQPAPLREHLLAAGYQITHHAAFADHHAFSLADIAAVAAQCRADQCVFTTQKDAVRLLAPELAAAVAHLPIFYIPIDVQFLAGGAAYLQQMLTSLFQPQAVV
jgi:tetraacyldisaccharide 4'-kinase